MAVLPRRALIALCVLWCSFAARVSLGADMRWTPLALSHRVNMDAVVTSSGDTLLTWTPSREGHPPVLRVLDRNEEIPEFGEVSLPLGFRSSDQHAIAVGGGGGLLLVSPDGSTEHVEWDVASGRLRSKALPMLPRALRQPVTTLSGAVLYLADVDGCVSLDVSRPSAGWKSLPAPDDFVPQCLAVQGDGDVRRLYAFGVSVTSGEPRTFVLDETHGRWIGRAGPPAALSGATAVASGQAHVLLITPGGSFTYHTITDTWISADDLKPGVGAGMLGDGSLAVVDNGGAVFTGIRPPMQSRFGWLDYAALAGYPALLLGVGLLVRVRKDDADGYFRGGQRIPWWAAGLSLVATQVSAIGFVAIPAKSFATDWVYFAGVGMWFIVVPIVTHYYIPLFRRLNVTTAYEYLETRFNFVMRVFASVMFMAMQVTRAAVVLYLPALALSAVTGIDKVWCIAAMGFITTVYTLWGGMQTVIWTDVVQAFTLLAGVLLCVVLVLTNVGGFGPFFEAAWGDGKFQLVSEHWGVAGPSLWVVLIGGVFTRLAALTSDQNVVQRYQATGSDREASRALWTDVAVSIPWAVLIFALGTALYVFFKHNPALLDPAMDTDQVVPLFIAERVPAGLAGLIIAAIFAASLDGSMLAVATAFVNDVYGWLRPDASPRARVAWARGVTAALGLFATITAAILATANVLSLWDQATRWTGLFAGGFAGLFILGLFTRRVGAAAAFVGLFASAIVMYFVETSGVVSVLIYAGFGVVSCVLGGLLASVILPARQRQEADAARPEDAPWRIDQLANSVAP